MHQDLGRLVTAVWGPAGLVGAVGRLHRATALRAEEPHGLGAYTAVSDLTGYATASSIHTAPGRLVHNTLGLALPHDRPSPTAVPSTSPSSRPWNRPRTRPAARRAGAGPPSEALQEPPRLPPTRKRGARSAPGPSLCIERIPGMYSSGSWLF